MTYRIRYTKGPDDLALGNLSLKRGEWSAADEATARQALLPARVEDYGFECEPALVTIDQPTAQRGTLKE